MKLERQYDEFRGKRGMPPGKEKCLIWSAGWARGVLMLMEKHQQNVFQSLGASGSG
jgi:hypothetical protein